MNGLGKNARNERKKLEAVTVNALGLAFGGIGVVQPLTAGDFAPLLAAKVLICGGVGYILHRRAMHILGGLED